MLRECLRRKEAGNSKNSNSRKVSRDNSSSVAGESKELARGIYRSGGRSRHGIRRHSSSGSNNSSSATINKGEVNKGEINKREAIKVGAGRIGADSLRSHSRESNGGRTRISRGIRQRRTYTHRMTVG